MHCTLLIVADDFGMSAAVNQAIVSAFERGWISATSMMANMPGFDEACSLAKERGLDGKIGVHINLVEGNPVTLPITKCPRLCDESGQFRKPHLRSTAHLSVVEARAVEDEIRCQVELCRSAGISPSHLDSHHHYHFTWPLGRIAMRVAQDMGIKRIRRNGCYSAAVPSRAARLYRSLYNLRLSMMGLAGTRHAYTLSTALRLSRFPRGAIEIAVHPRLDEVGRMVDLELPKEDFGGLIRRLREIASR